MDNNSDFLNLVIVQICVLIGLLSVPLFLAWVVIKIVRVC